MRAYVTGASGFVGAHVARELRERGVDVRDEWIDLSDRDGLRAAIEGCDAVFHLAALYSYKAPAAEHERVNVEGTHAVVELCRELGVRRLVHTSTCGTCGPIPGRQATEGDAPPDYELTVPYKRTKIEAERIVLAAAHDGLDAVVVNPTTPVGDGDRYPTPTGQMIEGVATGRYRAYVDTGINLVDVRDVARGHVLAWEHGRRGERYLLGGVDLTFAEVFAVVAELADLPRPRLRVPHAVARALGACGLVSGDEVRLARLPMYFSWAKAARELGYSPGPVWPALGVPWTTRSVLPVAEPLEELADGDHGDEDEPDDEHREHDVLAFLGDVGGQQRGELEHRFRTLTHAVAVRRRARRPLRRPRPLPGRVRGAAPNRRAAAAHREPCRDRSHPRARQ